MQILESEKLRILTKTKKTQILHEIRDLTDNKNDILENDSLQPLLGVRELLLRQ